MTRRILVSTAAFATVAAVAYSLAGPFGLVAVAALSTGVAVLTIRAVTVPAAPRHRVRPTYDPGPSGRFPRYEKLAEMLGWAPLAGRHFEYGVRRVITELVAQRLADRHRVDLAANPAAARALIGERCWPLVDPGISFADRESGVDLRLIDDLVSLMEEL